MSEIMYEQMVDEITKEVLRRLQMQERFPSVRKKTLLVLSDHYYPLSEKINNEYHVIHPDLETLEKVAELLTMVSTAELILVTSISVKQLSNLALGCGEGHLEEAIRYALQLGKSILLLEDGLLYRNYKGTTQKTFYRRLLEYEECIKGYGMQITTESALCLLEIKDQQSRAKHHKSTPDVLLDSKSFTDVATRDYVREDKNEETVILNKKLIQEKDLMALDIRTHSVICIEKSSIVTPSALDYARAHRMRLIRK